MQVSKNIPFLSIILPCLNEEKAIGLCLDRIRETIRENNLKAEVLVVDNNSTDRSAEIISRRMTDFPELILLSEKRPGYGSAYLCGLSRATGDYVFMADCDGTYDFGDIPRYLAEHTKGADVVIGNRFAFNMASGTMPWHHYHIGNPMLTLLVRILFRAKINDLLCGARSISRAGLAKISLCTIGMEFSAEMIIKAAKHHLSISEIPIHYTKRLGHSKLRSFRDGWRYLRFILLYSPKALFLIPGSTLFLAGLLSMLYFYFGNPELFGLKFYFHPMFISSLLLILGYQFIFFSGFATIYALNHLNERDVLFEKLFPYISIEKAGLAGIIVALLGLGLYIFILTKWLHSDFGSLNEIKNSLLALTLVALGVQTFFSSFMLSIIGIKEK